MHMNNIEKVGINYLYFSNRFSTAECLFFQALTSKHNFLEAYLLNKSKLVLNGQNHNSAKCLFHILPRVVSYLEWNELKFLFNYFVGKSIIVIIYSIQQCSKILWRKF